MTDEKQKSDWEAALQDWADTEDHWVYTDRNGVRRIVARCPYCERIPVPVEHQTNIRLACGCGRHAIGQDYEEAVRLWNDAMRPLWRKRRVAIGAVRQAIADDPTVQLDFVLMVGLQALGVCPDGVPPLLFHYLTGGDVHVDDKPK